MFTPQQASEMLEIPASTLRRYAQHFKAQLSENATKQRGRRYTEQDIALLAQARELINSGKTPEQAAQLLAVIGEEQPPPSTALAMIPSISQALSEALDTSRALRSQVNELSERLNTSEQLLAEMAQRLSALESERQKRWYQKIFRR